MTAPKRNINKDDSSVENSDLLPPMQGEIMKWLPKSTFDIDTKTSLTYFGIDLAAVVATLGFLDAVVTSDLYHAFPVWGQAMAVAPLQVLGGFTMWCMWCIGHDA